MACILQPLVLFNLHTSTELIRPSAIVQFADGNPPASPGSKSPPRVILGLWGGILEGTSLRTSTDPAMRHTVGALEW